MEEQLYSKTKTGYLLSSLLNNTDLLYDSQYPLDKSDFVYQAHKILFVSIAMLADKGVKTIQPKDIGTLLEESYPSQLNALSDSFTNGDWIGYVEGLKTLDNDEGYSYYYEEVRKFSILREYRDSGYNISKFWDLDKKREENNSKINMYTIKDIVEYFDKIQSKIKNKYIVNANVEEYKAGESFAETKKLTKETPMIGSSFQSPYLNSIYSGMFGFIFRSGKSGSGKSVVTYGDVMKASCTHYWDESKHEFVENKSFEGASLIINTELTLRTQVDPILVSWCSNVDRRHIRRGEYDSKEQEERVDKAGEIIKKSPIYLIDMPDFTIKQLEEKIEHYVKFFGVKTVCFDYVQQNPFVNKEVATLLNIPPREDLVLLEITNRLKVLQRKLNISLLSGSQLNGQEDNMLNPTECCLAGGKSQIRKLDGCMIMLRPKKQEQEAIEMITGKFGLNEYQCNRVSHIIKGRSNEYEEHIKVCQYVDMGTGRTYDLCVLTEDNKPYNVEKLIIESK